MEPAPASPPSPRALPLADGSTLLLRPIEPGDKEQLARGLARLSQRSRTRRFLAPVQRLSSRELRYLTELDYRDHMAWLALVARPGERPDEGTGVGVARYVRLREEPTVAEAAVVVLDEWQRRGIGTALMAALADSARANGVERFRGYVLRSNAPVVHALRELGARLQDEGGNAYRVDVPVPAAEVALRETLGGRLLGAAADGRLDPGALDCGHAAAALAGSDGADE